MIRHAMLFACLCSAACASGTASSATQPAPTGPRVTIDSTTATAIPAGLGTLRQDDIAIVLQPEGVRVTAIPLDESVIRTLAPDSYRSLRALLESRRQEIARSGDNAGKVNRRLRLQMQAELDP